jgi:hypothetical protein
MLHDDWELVQLVVNNDILIWSCTKKTSHLLLQVGHPLSYYHHNHLIPKFLNSYVFWEIGSGSDGTSNNTSFPRKRLLKKPFFVIP